MTGKFHDQVAVISGGADGLGRAIATRLGAEGAKLAIYDNNPGKLQPTVAGLLEAGYEARGFTVDISVEQDIARAFKEVTAHFGGIDIMINSAGIVGPTSTSVLDYSVDDFDKVYRVNLRGAFLMSKYALQAMEKRGYGRILLIASIAGKEGNPNAPAYSASKAGLIALTKSLGKELAQYDIAVNCVTPAAAKTAIFDQMTEEHINYMLAKIPRNRFVKVEEIAATVAFAASSECSFTTGAVFDLSGGRATY